MAFPEGHYTKVRVVNVLGGSGALSDGTGTSSATGVFSCGPFDKNDLPEITDVAQYKITATKDGGDRYEQLFKCVHSGSPTSDFKN